MGASGSAADICGIAFGNAGQLALLYSDDTVDALLLRPHAASPVSTASTLIPRRVVQMRAPQLITSGALLAMPVCKSQLQLRVASLATTLLLYCSKPLCTSLCAASQHRSCIASCAAACN